MHLPSVRTLSAYTKNWPSRPGLHYILFNALKLKIQALPEKAKNCIVCVDEISLKTNLFFDKSRGEIFGLEDDGENKTNLPSKYAIVIMIRGVTHRYKHLVGYYLVNSACPAKKIKNIIFVCVEKLTKVGMKPRVVISDQGGNFIGFNILLSITPKKPYFIVNNSKIFYMFDTPHLLKSFRNNFMKYKIVFNKNKTASWQDILTFYLLEKDKQFKLGPKLNNEHLYPNRFQKMKVKLAAQVISATVSNAIYVYSCTNDCSSTTVNTAETIERFDKLFDLFNSSKFNEAKQFRRPFFGNVEQINFLKEMEDILEEIRFFDGKKEVTPTIKFAKGWIQNINVLRDLYEDLKLEGVNYILTRNLNQDALENAFSMLRRRGGNSRS